MGGAKQNVAFVEGSDGWSETLIMIDLLLPVPATAIVSSDESDVQIVTAHRVPDMAMMGE